MRTVLAITAILNTALAFGQAQVPAFTISTVAGTGEAGFSGDGGPAIAAMLDHPSSVAVDPAGNLFIGDNRNHRVRKIDPNGIISTLIGTGSTEPQSETAGPAASMNLSSPYGVAADSHGNVYVTNRGHAKIYKVAPDGMCTTAAGTGEQGYNGDGIPATEAQISHPNHMAVGPDGLLYIADSGNDRIRRIDAAGVIHTFAGSGEEGFVDGPAHEAKLNGPSALAFGPDGSLYVADFGNHAVRKIAPGGSVSTIAGNGSRGYTEDGEPALGCKLNEVTGVVVDNAGLVYVADSVNCSIRVILPDGTLHTVTGDRHRGFSGDGGPATAARINIPDILCIDAAGSIYISDYQNNRVRKLTRE